MTEEEAIEIMKHWVDYEKENKNKINKADELIEVQETVLKLLQTKQEEIEKKKEDIQRMQELLDLSDAKNVNKDKIINAMAEQLTTPVHSKEWVIDYYTKKVEKENE